MEPNIHVNMVAVLVAVVANFIFGAIWFMPLFGRAWAKEMKMDLSQKPPKSAMYRGMFIMVIGNFLLAFVLAHDILAWNPVTWGAAPDPNWGATSACKAAFFTWLGFFLPVDLSKIAWEGASFKLFMINTVYHFLSLLIAAMILVMM